MSRSECEKTPTRAGPTTPYARNPRLLPATGTASSLAEGLYIRRGAGAGAARTAAARSSHLRRLQRTIVDAITAAGMESPPAVEKSNPLDAPVLPEAVSQDAGVLFRGTYGQVVTALVAAGLSITPCASQGVNNGSSLVGRDQCPPGLWKPSHKARRAVRHSGRWPARPLHETDSVGRALRICMHM
jgi:hypothetical protein